MSQPEGRSHSLSENEEEESDERATPLSAIAPEADGHYKQPTVISSNPALQCLDQLFSEGKISGAKVAHLRASFNLLHQALKSSQESEMQLLQEAKAFRTKLEEQNQELEKAELFPEGQDTEVSGLKQKLLQSYNELKEYEERDYHMQFQLECLKEEKLYLQKEYQNQPKPAELERRYMTLKESCEDMRKETVQLRQEVKTLAENVETQQKHTDKERCELDEFKNLVEISEAELAQVCLIPVQLRKEVNRVAHRKSEVDNQVAVMDKQRLKHMEHQQMTVEKCEKVKEAQREVLRELDGYKAQLMAAQSKQERLLKELQMTKEKEAIFMDQRGLLEINMEQIVADCKSLRDKQARDTRLKDRLVRVLKRNELQLIQASDALIHTQQQHARTQAQRDEVPDGDCFLQKRRDLEKEVEDLKRSLIIKQSMAGLKVQQVEEYLEQEQALIGESHRRRDELHHLHRLILIKADEREHKSRELLKAQLKYKRSKQDLQGKGLVLQEHKKLSQETKSRLNVFAKLYEVTKGERNKYMSLIQISNQNLEEVKEKLIKLEEDLQIMQPIAMNKDKILQKFRLQHSQCYKLRDHMKNVISRISQVLQEMHQKREEQKLNLRKLVLTITTQEQNLLHLRKSYEAAMQGRNERGVQLVEREQELCVFYERLNKLNGAMQEDNKKIQVMEDEIKKLKILQKEQDRQINLQRQQLSCIRALQEESTLLQIQLSESQDKVKELDKAVGDVNRAQELSGEDPSPEDLLKKIEELEVQLTEKEAQLLEMELVYEQVNHLSQRIRTKAENGKEDSLHLAKKVNELQAQIRERTHKMMAVVAELSMWQVESMTLQQEIKEKETHLDSCQMRLEQGLPPSDAIEQEWLRCLRDQHTRQANAERKLAEEDEWKQLPSGVYTTAELRPNAYIPTDDPLPVPKHYGALAPFKPAEPGANIRHIRKPKPKPIEI
ncbi:coiled-coil domain-containing protein 146 isoform X1 [Triplophysa rosa]|uniref:coiled-coil domain-containing protein 146 isoform X1 n=2 Tax=Triplophysa rosa TaxID=992332 RepID=UPI002545ED6F|nr:coiled-coil domain-containing protein 146 isoform X1 [Triplophysa rosa]XP_057180605.1 coiled-coil domain-containing protein 146 isoform X1 [Triplophysa rosa]XP_057180606.1 coiled-coil domain-containing protein 146 isoform X1 [Triplophysa rosa]